MQVAQHPRTYKIDISRLFSYFCTQSAVDATADLIGGFDKLTDICCHIALTLLKDNNEELANTMIQDVIAKQTIAGYQTIMVQKVLTTYVEVLGRNFLGIINNDNQHRQINHIQVHDAWHDYRVVNQVRYATCGDIKATIYWHE